MQISYFTLPFAMFSECAWACFEKKVQHSFQPKIVYDQHAHVWPVTRAFHGRSHAFNQRLCLFEILYQKILEQKWKLIIHVLDRITHTLTHTHCLIFKKLFFIETGEPAQTFKTTCVVHILFCSLSTENYSEKISISQKSLT